MDTSEDNKSWLKTAFVRFSQETTCQNEFELLGMTSQLHRDPGLISSLDALLTSIKFSLPKATVLGGAFVMLPYDEGVGTEKRAMAPMYALLGCKAIFMEKIHGLSFDADKGAWEFAHAQLLSAYKDQADSIGILQLPYFILKRNDLAENSSFADYENLFFEGKAIFSTPRYVGPKEDQSVLITKYRVDDCYQRFALLLALRHEDRWSEAFNDLELATDLGALLGSCLTWSGKSVADSTRWIMAAYAVKIAHFSHEIGKQLAAFGARLPDDPDITREFDQLKTILTIPAIDELLTTENIRRGTVFSDENARPSLARMLENAIGNCGSTEDGLTKHGPIHDSSLLVKLNKIEDVRHKTVQLEIQGLAADQQIAFDQRFFDRLIRNIFRNAAQHAGLNQTPIIRLTVTVHERGDFLEMNILNKGATNVSPNLARRLFRTPVSSRSSGIGLYTIGLMFESQRLPPPRATVDSAGLHFKFLFPKHAQ